MSRLIRISYLLLFFFTPLIYTSFNSELFELPKMYFVYSLTTAIFTLHLINWINGHTPLFRRTFLDLPLALFFLSQIVSTILSVDPHTSLYGYYSRLNGGLFSIISYALLYWILAVYLDDKFKQKIITFSLLSGLLVAGYGVLEHFGIDKNSWVQDVQTRVFSTLGQPNWLAAYVCILLPFSLQKLLDSKNLLHKSYFIFLTSSFYLCLLFTKSKSGILAGIISIIIYYLLYILKNKSKPLLVKGGVWGGFVLLFLVSLSLFINNPIKDRLFPSPLVKEGSGEIVNITPSEDIRKIVWQGAFDLWHKYPVFGTGVETFAYSYYWVRPVAHNLTSEWEFLYNKAHNEYLNYLATTGSFGFVTYCLVIISILFYLLRSLLLKRDLGRLNLPIFAAFISILITDAAGFSVVIIALYFFLLPVLSLSESRIQNQESKPKFFIVLILLVSVLLESRILSFYLADIAYAQSDSADNQQQYALAHQYLSSAISFNPYEPLYLSKIATLEAKLAILAHSEKDETQAVRYSQLAAAHSQKAIQDSPVNTNYLKEQAQTYYYLASVDKTYFSKAIDALYQASQIAPTDAKTYYLIGEFLHSVAADKEALPYLLQAIKLKPNYDHATFMAGQIYFNDKKYPEAKAMFEQTLQIAPTNTDAQEYLQKIKMVIK